MAEEEATPSVQAARQAANWQQPDWFLQLLVNMTNMGDSLEIGMTLLIGGFLVSGKMVGGLQYFEGVGSEFVNSLQEPTAGDGITKFFAECADVYKRGAAQQVEPPAYIHMKDTRFFNTAGNPIPGNRGVWWRCRLSEVGGFTVGMLGIA